MNNRDITMLVTVYSSLFICLTSSVISFFYDKIEELTPEWVIGSLLYTVIYIIIYACLIAIAIDDNGRHTEQDIIHPFLLKFIIPLLLITAISVMFFYSIFYCVLMVGTLSVYLFVIKKTEAEVRR